MAPLIQDITQDIKGFDLHYRNDTRLRRAETKIALTNQHVEEYIKCKNDIIYFIENYCKINDPNKGWGPPTLYGWQKDLLRLFQKERFVVIMCARQNGKTTISGLFLCWYMIFYNDKTNLILAQRAKSSREIFGKMFQTYRSIPHFLKAGVYEANKSSIQLDTGSRIMCDATTEQGLRGPTVNGCLFIDEVAAINKNLWEEFYTAVLPTISRAHDSKMILVSTPKGKDHFYEIWNAAVSGESSFKPFKATWRDIPGRDDSWKVAEMKKMTGTLASKEARFQQEYECVFLHADTNAVISSEVIQKIEIKPPTGKQFDDHFRVYEPPLPNAKYALCVDCATGAGGDDSVVQVILVNPPKGKPFRQVAVYQNNNVDLTAFPYVIDKIHKQYNNGMILIENNAEAYSVVKDLIYELENEEVFNDGVDRGSLGGIKTTPKVKKKGVSSMKELIEGNGLELCDAQTVNQLGVYVAKGAKFAAKSGFHDDLVSPLVTFGYFVSMDLGKEIIERDILKDIHLTQIKEVRESFITPILISSDGDDEVDSIGGGFDWGKPDE